MAGRNSKILQISQGYELDKTGQLKQRKKEITNAIVRQL